MLYRDELTGFLANLDRQGREGDRAFFLEAWNGDGGFTYDRIGRGTIHIQACCVSILGGIQPEPLKAYLREVFGGGGDDGLVQRFQLLVWPDIARDWHNCDRWPDRDARDAAAEVFKRLDALSPTDIGAEQQPDSKEVPFLRFAPDAQEFFDRWRADLEARVRADDDHPVIISHLAKYRSLMPSLALLFELIARVALDGAGGGGVSMESAAQAAAWCDYLESHARRVYQTITSGPQIAVATLAEKLRAGKLSSPFRARDIYRAGWTALSNADEVHRALDCLVDMGWLRKEEIRATDGGRPTVQYQINPRITP